MGNTRLDNKKILVVGLGVSGLSVCYFLHRQGVAFEVADNRNAPPNLDELESRVPDVRCHKQFDEALFCQFDLLILSPGLPVSLPSVQAALAAGIEVIGDIELFARAAAAPIIAVTGSNGKSTVVAWLASVMAVSPMHAVLCGNIGVPALDALDDDADLYILELSSFQLETTVSLQALSATVLNISEDHMDRYQDLEHYAATKRRIYDGAQLAVVNAQDPRTLPAQEKNIPVMKFSAVMTRTGQQADNVGLVEHESETWLALGDSMIIPVAELPLPGAHNCANAQAVIALLSPLSLAPDSVSEGLRAFTGLPHRTQLVRQHNGIRWYNDSKGTNIDACCKAIEAMQCPVVLIAGGQGKNADFGVLRPMVDQHVKALVLLGEDADKLYQALHDLACCQFASSMKEAVAIAAGLAADGDAVLLSPACASFDMFKSFEHRGEVFAEAVLEMAA